MTISKINKYYRNNKLYDGINKSIYSTSEDFVLVQFFKDSLKTNNQIINIDGKGIINNIISSFIMKSLDIIGVEHHFLDKINMREQLVQAVDVMPIQVVVNNIASKDYANRFGIDEGQAFDKPLIEFKFKNDKEEYILINESQISNFNGLCEEEINDIKKIALNINSFITGIFIASSLKLIECKLEFGRAFDGNKDIMILIDQISPDNCTICDVDTNEKLGYDYAINNPDNGIYGYQDILERLRLK